MNLKNIFIFLFMFLITSIGFAATVAITEQPTFPVDSGDNYTIKWSVIPESGETVVSTSLKFKNLDGSYTEKTKITTVASQYSYTLTNDAAIPTKQFYKIEAVTSSGTYYSLESYIVLQAKVIINPISPKGDITTTTPTFEWEPIVGAAGYKLILSGSPISVDTDSNGDTNISGGNIIWQVSTTKTKLSYGEAGDIGTDVGNPAPLTFDNSDGIKEYYYIIMPMFGTTEGSTSTSVPSTTDMTKFNLNGYSTISSTSLISPTNGIKTQEDYINFSWNSVEGANLYHVYIEELVDMQGISTRALVYDEATKATNLNIYAPGTFKSAKYYWYVITEGQDGGTSKSDEFSFTYDVPSKNIYGAILDNNNKPLERAEVYLVTTGGNKINIIPELTDTDGKYTINNVLPGTYYIEAVLEGYSQTTNPKIDVLTTSPDTVNVNNVLLTVKNSNLAGTIKDKDSGIPLKGAIVTAFDYNGNEYQGISDTNGYFNFKIDAGQWNIKYEYSGYTTKIVNDMNVLPGTTLNLGDTLLVANNVSLNGKVYTENGEPIVNANVVLYNNLNRYEVKTLQDGSYSFSLQPGDWNLYSYKTGFVTSNEQIQSFLPGANKTVNITLVGNASTITGKVLDNYNRGVIGAHLVFEGSSIYEADTDNLGNYQISLKKGDYTVKVIKNGYTQQKSISQSVGYGEAINLSILMNVNSSSILGRIEDSNGEPISGAKITAGDSEVYSNSNGEYSLTLRDGTYNLSAYKAGYASAGKSITIGAGDTISGENFTLNANVVILEGKILDKDSGAPLGGVSVVAGNVESFTDNFGKYRLELLPGSYNITINKTLYKAEAFDIILMAGSNILGKDVLIQKNIGYIEGNVYTKNGIPVNGANVLVGDINITTNDIGHYKIALIPGIYKITVNKAGYNSSSVDNVTVDLSKTVTQDFNDLELQPLTLKGMVRDSQGNAMSGIKVYTDKTETYTDGSGKFILGTLPGNITVHTEKYGYSDINKLFNVVENMDNLILNVEDVRATISGTVNIPNAKVKLSSSNIDDIIANTDDNGNFLLKAIAGTYNLTVSKIGYKDYTESITVSEKEIKPLSDISLQVETGNISISANQDSVTVYIAGVVSRTINLNTAGTAVDEELPYGDYKATFVKDGYSSETKSIVIPTDISVSGTLTQLGGKITGTITNGANAKLSLEKDSQEVWSGFADDFGKYATPKLEDGTYTIKVKKEGYKSEDLDITISGSNKEGSLVLKILDGKIGLNFSLPLEASYILKTAGNVIRRGDFNSDSLNIDRLDLGKYTVEIIPSKSNVKVADITIPELTTDVKIQTVNEIKVTKYDAKILAKIVSGINVIPNAIVKLKDGDSVLKIKYSDIEGNVRFEDLEENKDYTLDILKYGYNIPEGTNTTFKALNTTSVNTIKLDSIVANISLQTTTGASIKLYTNENVESLKADENGAVTIEALKNSQGILQVSKDGYITKSINVTVDSNGKMLDESNNEIKNVLLEKEAYISGNILNGSYATIKTNTNIVISADSEGKFEIKGLKAATNLEITVTKFGYKTVTITKSLVEGENVVNSTLEKLESTITIIVKDKSDNPITGVEITLNNEVSKTDTNGTVMFDRIPYNEDGTKYNLSIKEGISKIEDVIVVSSNAITKTYNIERKESSISGKIINGENAKINIFDSNGAKVLRLDADSTGAYDTGKVLGKGTYTLLLSKIGFKENSKQVEISTNSEDKIVEDLTLIPMEMRFEGIITDSTGAKISDAAVRILDNNGNLLGEGYSGGDGYYNIILEYKSGNYKLNVRKNSYSEVTKENLVVSDTDFVINSSVKIDKSTDQEAPVIEDKTEIKEYKKDNTIKFVATITDNEIVKDAKLYYTVNNGNINSFDLTKDVNGEYVKEFTLNDAGTLTYYIEASDGANITKTETKTIEIVGDLSIVKIVPEIPVIVKGNAIELEAKGYDKYGHIATTTSSSFKWEKISDNGVATLGTVVDKNIVSVTGNKVGIETIEVNVDGLITSVDVKVIEVNLDKVKLELQLTSSQVKAGTTVGYSLMLIPEGTSGFEVKPDNVIIDSSNAVLDENTQKIKTQEGIVGKFVITVRYKNKTISKNVEVYETANSNAKEIRRENGVKLNIAEDSLTNNEVINIIKTAIPSLPEGNLDIAGDVYKISPEFKILGNSNTVLTLPIPSNIDLREVGEDSLGIYRWNGIEWEEIDNGKSVNSDSISVNINRFGKYAIMVLSEPLGITDFEIYPNPFTPANGGTLIGYKFTSAEQSIVYATIKIYTENGKLVKTLVDNDMRSKLTKYYEKWDGLDNNGNEVKNGRYIVRLTIEDIAGELSENKVVILLK
ncbi:carboxypeptidase regulatory-like domain-containing protein [Haliovirga abyssi]|uniref:T9SS C-terminal target domain-containing protein n=1 Tax=Haliovirga abyssi TaxID=2996794 RepID=A0AAU9E279_9FUSO|nr:carboxypeptidase regulatory-like domain-containing protein [Haliovirga abyssi]BDU50505.1 hypothetical protein HLVA_10740 [Haliovirga abyssi]